MSDEPVNIITIQEIADRYKIDYDAAVKAHDGLHLRMDPIKFVTDRHKRMPDEKWDFDADRPWKATLTGRYRVTAEARLPGRTVEVVFEDDEVRTEDVLALEWIVAQLRRTDAIKGGLDTLDAQIKNDPPPGVLAEAIARGGFELSPCGGCGKTTVCLPDGMGAICTDCHEKGYPSEPMEKPNENGTS